MRSGVLAGRGSVVTRRSMRSLRTAARTVVLVTLTGVAPGCGYDNPGFKLKDSDPDSDSAAQTTNVSGVTMMTTTETSPTSTSTSTTSEPMTTQGPGVSGSETSGTSVDPTTEPTMGTTGDPPPWDAVCPGEETPHVYNMDLDTFFMFENESTGGCDIGGGDTKMSIDCNDLSFGGSATQQVFNFFVGPGEEKKNFTRKVFVVRYEAEKVIDMGSGEEVPPEAVIDLTLEVNFERISAGPAHEFWLKPVVTNDKWQAGSLDAEECVTGAASWHCRQCVGEALLLTCAEENSWAGPYEFDEAPITTFVIDKPNGYVGIMLSDPIKVQAEYAQLRTGHPGYVIVPSPGLSDKLLKIHTSEAGKPPKLTLRYCPKPMP